jgi:hypothetical protein
MITRRIRIPNNLLWSQLSLLIYIDFSIFLLTNRCVCYTDCAIFGEHSKSRVVSPKEKRKGNYLVNY